MLGIMSAYNRPYALMSHLHNNDAMLGVKTSCAACTCCAGRVLALSRCAGPGRPGGMACRGWPASCMLGDGACNSASFDPQHAGAPFCDVICIRSIQSKHCYCVCVCTAVRLNNLPLYPMFVPKVEAGEQTVVSKVELSKQRVNRASTMIINVVKNQKWL